MNDKNEPIITVLIYQLIVCVLAFSVILASKLFFNDFYNDIKAFYDKNMKNTTEISEVID